MAMNTSMGRGNFTPGYGISSISGEIISNRFEAAMGKRKASRTYPLGGRKSRMFKSASSNSLEAMNNELEGTQPPTSNSLSSVAIARHIAALTNSTKKVTLRDVHTYCDLRGVPVHEITAILWPELFSSSKPGGGDHRLTEADKRRRASLGGACTNLVSKKQTVLGGRLPSLKNKRARSMDTGVVNSAPSVNGGGSVNSESGNSESGFFDEAREAGAWDSLEAMERPEPMPSEPTMNIGLNDGRTLKASMPELNEMPPRMRKSRSVMSLSDIKNILPQDLGLSPTGLPFLRRRSRLENVPTDLKLPPRKESVYRHINPCPGIRNTNMGPENLVGC